MERKEKKQKKMNQLVNEYMNEERATGAHTRQRESRHCWPPETTVLSSRAPAAAVQNDNEAITQVCEMLNLCELRNTVHGCQ